MIETRPYKLINQIQNYSWGTKNGSAFIPKLIGFPPESNISYAELWMGAHKSASSKIIVGDRELFLSDAIEKYPNQILGKSVVEKFGKTLPFLFKVLSAGEPLSIQAHPNKRQARVLHKRDPVNYPDENHKPEIAVAIDKLEALVGFRPLQEIL
ncbi:MAG: mannose-6-phosphate isomerase, class I, partial [Bacteroidetes bacterium]|nr:mannose-6-phosphate isomerase, class I [Bacteroidota bacterium]